MKNMTWVVGCCALLLACGDSGSDNGGNGGDGGSGGSGASGGSGGSGASGGDGGSSDGGAPVGGGGNNEGGGTPDGFTLDVAPDPAATVTCATFVDGVWGVAETSFVDDNPESDVANEDCALVAVVPDLETEPYWITSNRFEGKVGPVDDLRHAFSTAEAAIAVGTKTLELFDYDAPDTLLFSGNLTVVSVDGTSVVIQVE